MATFRQTINRVLVSLGQAGDLVADSAKTLTDEYHTKVAQVVNDILAEVEAAAQWRALYVRDTVTVSANALSGTLTSSNSESRVFQSVDAHHGRLMPLCFDVTTTTAQDPLRELDLAELLRRDQGNDNDSETGGPSHFALAPDGADGMALYLWPRQTVAVDVEIDMIVPQGRLPHTSLAELDTVIKTPAIITQLGATWWLMEDRGEEFGAQGGKQEMRYNKRLSDAVALEHDQQGLNDLVIV